MRYHVRLGSRELSVDLEARPDGTLRASVQGRELPVDLVAFSPRDLSLRVGARVVDLTVEGAGPELGLVASGRRAYVHVESERQRQASRATRGGAGSAEREVRSPMPGRVVKVLVAVGDVVPAGGAVAIVEAMKMENEVKARRGGTVKTVHCLAGATVEGSAPLVTFE
jgi:biotin carboxyl carrier protein